MSESGEPWQRPEHEHAGEGGEEQGAPDVVYTVCLDCEDKFPVTGCTKYGKGFKCHACHSSMRYCRDNVPGRQCYLSFFPGSLSIHYYISSRFEMILPQVQY